MPKAHGLFDHLKKKYQSRDTQYLALQWIYCFKSSNRSGLCLRKSSIKLFIDPSVEIPEEISSNPKFTD